MERKKKKVEQKRIVEVSITQCKDKNGRYFFTSIRRDGSKLNSNAVWTKDYDQAMRFAVQFFANEKDYVGDITRKTRR